MDKRVIASLVVLGPTGFFFSLSIYSLFLGLSFYARDACISRGGLGPPWDFCYAALGQTMLYAIIGGIFAGPGGWLLITGRRSSRKQNPRYPGFR